MKKGVIVVFLVLVLCSSVFAISIKIDETKDVPMTDSSIHEGIVPEKLREKVTRHVYGLGHVADISDGKIMYYSQDRLGSTRVKTNSEGEVIGEFKSLPFGQEVVNRNVKYSFATGKELDPSDLYYFGARYYDPDLGRFTSVDPIGDNHAYAYVNNNPMNYVDPTGMDDDFVGTSQKPIAAIIYNSQFPEFIDEASQFMSNYGEDYEFRVYSIYGREEIRNTINEINLMIESGRNVQRIIPMDHYGSKILGLKLAEWKTVDTISSQEGRRLIPGICHAGEARPGMIFDELTRIAGVNGFVGTVNEFAGFTRYPVENDWEGVLTHVRSSNAYFSISSDSLSNLFETHNTVRFGDPVFTGRYWTNYEINPTPNRREYLNIYRNRDGKLFDFIQGSVQIQQADPTNMAQINFPR